MISAVSVEHKMYFLICSLNCDTPDLTRKINMKLLVYATYYSASLM